ncbi:MAG TPA: agmatinase [Bacteroidales bacterium]|jgi:agmatinase|nr:agmatinase [Bacteroidales bacterium]
MNFGGHEVVYGYDESEIVILPVPYDETSTWLRGADKGPDAILNASPNLEFFDVETMSEAHLHGIFTASPVLEKETPGKLVDAVYLGVKTLITEGKFPVVIGGNHTVPIGCFRAFAEKFENLTILQLDAHADLRQEYEGSEYNHACAMARAREYAPIVQLGIRSMSKDELPYFDRERMFFAHELYHDKGLYDKALALLTKNVYLTIDLDVLDPSLMPSTGTPEPGGPEYPELMSFLGKVISQRNLVGFDVVELCPSESNKAPDFVAAKMIYQLLSYKFA